MKKYVYLLFCILAFSAYALITNSCGNSVVENKYKIARDPTWYPLHLANKQEDLLAFSDELIMEIASREHVHADLVLVGPNNLYPGLRNGQYDAIISSLLPSTITEREFAFSEPFFLLGPVLLVRANSTVSSLEEMAGQTIGVQRNSSVLFEVAKYPSIIIVPFENILTGLYDVEDGILDGIMMNSVPAYLYTTGAFKARVKIATAPLTKEGLRLIAIRGTPGEKIIELFNQGLKELKQSEEYKTLVTKWHLFNDQ